MAMTRMTLKRLMVREKKRKKRESDEDSSPPFIRIYRRERDLKIWSLQRAFLAWNCTLCLTMRSNLLVSRFQVRNSCTPTLFSAFCSQEGVWKLRAKTDGENERARSLASFQKMPISFFYCFSPSASFSCVRDRKLDIKIFY